MEDLIHKSGPIELWRFVSYRGGEEGEDAPEKRVEERAPVAAALRRALDILKRFPEALQAVQAGLAEAPA